MLRELAGGLGMMMRRWPQLITVGIMFAMASLVLSIVLGDVLSQVAVLRGGVELRERRAVAFTPYYPNSAAVSQIPDATVRFLAEEIQRGRAYASVVFNVQVDDNNFAGGHPVIVLFGDAVGAALPGVRLCQPAPCAMRGAAVVDYPVAAINFAGERLTVEETLPVTATFVDPNLAGLSLRERVLLNLPARSLLRINPIEREEAFTKTVLLGPSPRTVDAFVSGSALGGLRLIPQDLAVAQRQGFQQTMISSGMYVVGFMAFIALVAVTFASSVAETLRREAKTIMIRRMAGATPLDVRLRVGAFLSLPTLVAPLPPVALLLAIGEPVASGARVVALVMAGIFLVLWTDASGRALTGDPWSR